MSENIWYVTTHPGGLEASPEGLVQWVLPGNRPNVTVAPTGRALNLRSAVALLDVLEAEIYEAEPVGPEPHDDAVVLDVRSARLVRRTGWDTRRATMFAIDCAAHVLASSSPAILPDGTELGTVLVDARWAATASDGRGDDRLDYWARVSAMRRIRHDREQLAELSRAIVLADERRDVDALDDAPYASTVAVTDAVLAATEALRHHLLPHVYTDLADRFDDRMELRELDL
ncbi:MAG: hypothetical protein JST73_04640, partial [Actinobacteria bacterium]|nr:hypothetical protein [Actinomycetota bacterium]